MDCGNVMMTLTEALLLLLSDEDGTPLAVHQDILDCALAGAVLMDLGFAGRIDTDLEGLFVSDATLTGDPVLDSVLARISAGAENQATGTWIRKLMTGMTDTVHDRALASLEVRGILERRRGLLAWPSRHVIDAGWLRRARQDVAGVLLSQDIPDPREVALVSLTDACGVLPDILTPPQFRRAKRRIDQLRRMDLVGREVAGEVAEIERATLRAVRARTARFRRLLLILSATAGIVGMMMFLVPRVPVPDHFGPGLAERLWFNSAWKQWSGYVLVALTVGGVASVVARRYGKFATHNTWRLVHAGLGVACLGVLFIHTGFRFGANINAALMACYLGVLVLGGLAGIMMNGASLMRQLGIPPRQRALACRLHLYALVPLPALMIIHILVVYLY